MWQAALLSDTADSYCFFFKTMWCFTSSFPIYTPTKSTGSAATELFNRMERVAVLRTGSLTRRRLLHYFTGSITTYFGGEIICTFEIINRIAVSWFQSVKESCGMNDQCSILDNWPYGLCVSHRVEPGPLCHLASYTVRNVDCYCGSKLFGSWSLAPLCLIYLAWNFASSLNKSLSDVGLKHRTKFPFIVTYTLQFF